MDSDPTPSPISTSVVTIKEARPQLLGSDTAPKLVGGIIPAETGAGANYYSPVHFGFIQSRLVQSFRVKPLHLRSHCSLVPSKCLQSGEDRDLQFDWKLVSWWQWSASWIIEGIGLLPGIWCGNCLIPDI